MGVGRWGPKQMEEDHVDEIAWAISVQAIK